MCRPKRRRTVCVALLSLAFLASSALAGPKIWIFGGDPGDEEHHELYQKNLTSLRKIFNKTYGIAATDLKVFYGPKEAGYDGVCSKEVLLAELKQAVAATKDKMPVWIILQGHANSIPGGVLFNLPGPDVSAREIGEALEGSAPETPLVIFATTAASEQYLRPLAAPGRIVITANSSGDPENQTDFPLALTAALEAKGTDIDGDGLVTVTELFKACHAQIEAMASKDGHMIREHSQMDGNGDGRATRRPAIIDAEPASKTGLRIGGEKTDGAVPGFD
ncbi:hypothetical protein OKA05_01050 [Luteolibacter arcticus]|uniref:EF-hand domain-containing protein n=1 Tax=Luteolibacter arcticus TaxID=1581411 RepID=A0ABT3GBW4_9BACT|nr:hypothetical protein [Luteolibacter arcticus]MCW1921119.1 hypothetical protein [Luteolibacter arcticus]